MGTGVRYIPSSWKWDIFEIYPIVMAMGVPLLWQYAWVYFRNIPFLVNSMYDKFSRLYVTGSGKTGLIATITDIHFLPVRESCTHALPRNTKYLIIDGQVCFYKQLFTDAVKPPGCISWPWRALIGLHGVPGCSSRQSWPPLWILPVCVPY